MDNNLSGRDEMNCTKCNSDDMYDNELCWDCYDFENESGKAKSGRFSTKECPNCLGHFATQYGNYSRHFVACAA